MIRTLRRKFIAIAMLSLLGTLTVLCGAIAAGNAYITADRADRAIDLLYQNSGEFPSPPEARPDPSGAPEFQVTPETPFETRYFIVELTDRREVQTVDTDHIAALDRQTVVECVNDILADGGSRGYVEYYRFGVFEDQGGGSTVIVLDCFLQLQSAYNMLRVTLLVALACAGIVFLLLAFFSRRAIRPFVENLERQRQFVTDANHELKTPLTLIRTNLDIMESENGPNEWLSDIREETGIMTELVNRLVQLSRMDEDQSTLEMTRFSLSEAVSETAAAFDGTARERDMTLTLDVPQGVCCTGDEAAIRQLLSILLDNAVKYCDKGGTIRVGLSGGRHPVLTVDNSYAAVDSVELGRLFDRFYRADKARTYGSGFGIGLSIAKAIVEKHRGEITVSSLDGRAIRFRVKL